MYLIQIYDDGTDDIVITGTREVKDENIYDEKWFRPCSKEVFQYVHLHQLGQVIRLNKTLAETADFTVDDFQIEMIDQLRNMKCQALTRYKSSIAGMIDLDFSTRMYLVNVITAQFMQEGIFITDANREEKYLEILNTGDPEMISTLEAYLEHADWFNSHKSTVNRYIEFSNNVEACETQEEVFDVYNKALGRNLEADLLFNN